MARNMQKCIPWRIITNGKLQITSTNLRTRFCSGLSLLWVIQSHEKQTPSRIRYVLSNPKLDHIKFDYGVPVHPLVCDINATSQILETFFDFLFNWMHRRCNGTSSGPKLKVSFWSGEDSRASVSFVLSRWLNSYQANPCHGLCAEWCLLYWTLKKTTGFPISESLMGILSSC